MSYWNKPGRIELLKKLWASGLSASAISSKLGDGATRNSVIGKSHRLKLEKRITSKKLEGKKNIEKNTSPGNTTQKLGRKARFRALLLDKSFEPENPIYDISKLTDQHCRYPNNHPGEDNFYYCGRKPFENSVYCRLHLMLSFQPKNPKEEDQIDIEEIPKFIGKKIRSV